MSDPLESSGHAAPLSGIAIIGMAGRFPKAASIAEFWRNLCAGVDGATRFTDAELEDSFGREVRDAENFVKVRPVLEGVEEFDASFFGMYAREADLTDPQQRVFLEICWEALEDAAYDPQAFAGAIGVFAGASPNTYFLSNVLADREKIQAFTNNYPSSNMPVVVGAGQDFVATRVAYKLDLKGPALTLQAACSTSLLAVAKACQSLLLYESDLALAGGVSIVVPQKRGYLHLEGAMVSSDGTCRPFDDAATGTVFGNGAGVVLLKRLEEAVADGDHIYAVIRGSAVNNDGASKVGFSAPSVSGQAAVIEMALAASGVDARSISYVECHGTATPMGDPIEVAALTQAFAASTADRQFCALGSVKSNVGHLDAAAGVTGLIKTALALEHRLLPATLHFRRANRQIDFGTTPFYVNDTLTAWPDGAAPRRAGVSAFGVGGTNVHVVLEQAPPVQALPVATDAPQLIVLSARSAAALEQARRQLAARLSAPAASLEDIAYTLQVGRRAFDQRLSLVARSVGEAAAILAASADAGVQKGTAGKTRPRVVFMFPGQGAQYLNMGRDLFDTEPEFRRHLESCASLLEPLVGYDLRGLLYPAADSPEATARLLATGAAQPAIFCIEYALAKLWMSWGITPDAMIGHSIGEFVAAVLAGVFSLEDALALVAARGRLMQALPGGAMLAVRLPESEVRSLLKPTLAIAAINGPALCVVSGPYAEVAELEVLLAARHVVSRRLHTSHAFHSPMVDPVVEPLRLEIESMRLAAPAIPYVSCVSGDWILAGQAQSPAYWASHAREAVRFADGIAAVCGTVPVVLIEVGPGNALSTLARQNTRGRDVPVISSMQDAERARGDREALLDAVGRAWTCGVPPDWERLHGSRPSRVSLPTYPFERTRHWIDVQRAPAGAHQSSLPQDVSVMNQSPDRTVDIRSQVAGIFEELSGEAPQSADAETTFLEMGYDSLFLTQVAQKIQSQMGVKITFRQLLGDYATIPALAAFLDSQMPQTEATLAPAASPVGGLMQAMAPAATLAAAPGGVEGIFREQLQAMSQLINRQFEALQALGLAAPTKADVLTAPAAEAPRSALFQMYRPSRKPVNSGISDAQRRHIDSLIARTVAKTPGSKRDTAAYRSVSADPRVAAGFRSEWKEMVYPIVVRSASGSKLIDVDDNEYIDLVNGYGQTALGHSPDFVVTAVRAQLDKGFPIGPQAELTGRVAGLFCELTGNERATFCNTGSEAVMAAIRVARTVTGRDKIVIFNGDYHGQFDEVLVKGVQKPGTPPRSMPAAPGIPTSNVQNMIVLEYGSDQTLEWIRKNAQEVAAVIVEPVQSRHPNLRPFDFMREVRAITEAAGTVFVMDEVVTGFRVHPGGMQAIVGIQADLATYGKVVGGGLPVGVLAGKARFMDALDGGNWNYGDDSIPETGVTFFAGTFVRHPLLLAAAWAVLNHLKDQGAALQETLSAKTARLVERLQGLFSTRGLATRIETYASWFYFNLHNEHPLGTLLYYHLRLRGIHIQDGFPCFLTTAHSDADCDRIYDAFESALQELQSVGILGTPAEAAAAPALVETAAGPLPLTESQMEIWLAAQLGDAASCAFNESVSLRFKGRLNEPALRASLTDVVARHDALRATFSATGEGMRIAEPRAVDYPFTDLSNLTAQQAEAEYAALVDGDARTAFDLIDGPTSRAHLVKLADDAHVLLFTVHHIVCDGWSINIVVNELAEIYGKRSTGKVPVLPPAPTFSAYARSQAKRDLKTVQSIEDYWVSEFAARVAPLELPTDRPRPERKSFNGASLCRRIDAKLYQAIKTAGARRRSTLFVTLLAAFQTLMGRLAQQNEVVVGVPTAGQAMLEEQNLVGHCVNFLPIRGAWAVDTRIGDFLSSMAQRVLDAYEHQDYTFGTLVQKLGVPREPGRLPLAEIQFNLERLPDRIRLPGLDVDVTPNPKAHVNFDLFLNVIESAEGLRLDCDYNTDLFDAETVGHWLDCYQALLEAIVADADQRVIHASCIPAAERERLLFTQNETAADYQHDVCVHQLIEAQALASPDAVAVQFGNDIVTYRALNNRANQLAHLLRDRLPGAKTGFLIGVCVQRSIEMLVALIAVHKAGCAYVPLDPAHPVARLRGILAEAEVAALISDGSEGGDLVDARVARIDVHRDNAALRAAPTTAPLVSPRAEDLAYVIYTSGSTGLPKGVEISHRSVVNLLEAMAQEPGLQRNDVLYAVTTISFDIAALELFLPLAVGAKVVIAERDTVLDGYQALQQINAVGATAMQATPSGWRLLLEAGFRAAAGFKMLCGGEALPRDLADRLLQGSGELWNMYGPTETTIWSSCARVSVGSDPVTVGRPIANTQFYVLDVNREAVPYGVPGELYIGGDGVARGYYKREELNVEKFIANPFKPGRMYRTGDAARWLHSGHVQILGRIDHQIKLRGFRIEAGEIESLLVSHAGVSAAAVLLREDRPGAKRLVAYYVAPASTAPTAEKLADTLSVLVPDYMVPSEWVRMDALPLNPNGKLDKSALPVPDAGLGLQQEFIAPSTPTEATLTQIFAEVLRLERIGITDDLLKLGTDSIQLFQITARANRAGFKISARQLLQLRTAAALAALIDSEGAASSAPLPSLGDAPPGPPTLPTLGQFQRSRRAGSNARR